MTAGDAVVTLHPVLDGIDLVVFDKDGTLISFDAMWSGWARELGVAPRDRHAGGPSPATSSRRSASTRSRTGSGRAGRSRSTTMAADRGARRGRPPPLVPERRGRAADRRRGLVRAGSGRPRRPADRSRRPLRGPPRRPDAGSRSRRPTTADRPRRRSRRSASPIVVEAVVCGDDAGPTKPDPAALLGARRPARRPDRAPSRWSATRRRTCGWPGPPAPAASIGVASGVDPAGRPRAARGRRPRRRRGARRGVRRR